MAGQVNLLVASDGLVLVSVTERCHGKMSEMARAP